MRLLLLIAMALTLAACSEARIDTTSDETLQESIQLVRADLDDTERAEFDAMFGQIGMSTALLKGLGGTASLPAALAPINGMTGKEVLVFVRAKRAENAKAAAERAEKQRAEDQAEMAGLQSADEAHKNGLARIGAISVEAPSIREEKSSYRVEHNLVATVTNKLDVAIAQVAFTYSVRSPERTVPWREGEGTFVIDGGLEPGETREVEALNGFAGFIGAAKALKEHPDALLTLQVTDAVDGAKQSIVPRPLNEWQSRRLQELRDKLAEKSES